MRSGFFSGLITANRGKIRERLFLLAVCMIAVNIIWRVVRYSMHFPLWPDEGKVAMNFVGQSLSGLADPAQHYYVQIAPLFFWLVQFAAAKVLGISDWSLRFLPFVAGICGTVLFYRLSTRLLPPREALLSVAFLAASYYPVRHATEVKPYSIDLLATVVILILGLRLFENRASIRDWLLFAFAGVSAVWFSYTSVFAIGGVMLVLLPDVLREEDLKVKGYWTGAGLLLAASFALSLFLFALPMKNLGAAYYDMWSPAFPPLDRPWMIPWWLLNIHAGTLLAYPVGGKNFGSSVTLILVIAGAVILWRRNRREALFVLAPAALSLLGAFLKLYPYGDSDRTTQHLVPTICLLAGVGLLGLLKKFLRAKRVPSAVNFAVGVLCVIAISGIVHSIVKPYFSKYDAMRRNAVAELARISSPNDTWVMANSLRPDCVAPNGYKRISHSPVIFYWHVLAPCEVVWDNPAEASPRPGTTMWVISHTHSYFYGLKREDLDKLLGYFTDKFGAPTVKKWELDSGEKMEAFAFHVPQ